MTYEERVAELIADLDDLEDHIERMKDRHAALLNELAELQRNPPTYELADDGRSIKCRKCGLTSHNSNDVENLYCGNCCVFHTRETR
jgi:hypothetical protein